MKVVTPRVIAGCGAQRHLTITHDFNDANFCWQSAHMNGHGLVAWGMPPTLSCTPTSSSVIYVVDVESGQHIQSLMGHTGGITCVQWLPRLPLSFSYAGPSAGRGPNHHDGEALDCFLLSADVRGSMRLWNVAAGTTVKYLDLPDANDHVCCIACAGTNQYLILTHRGSSYVLSLNFGVDGQQVAVTMHVQECALPLPTSTPAGAPPLIRQLCFSRLSHRGACAVVLRDRLRVFASVDAFSGAAQRSARDLIYDVLDDGQATVVDACFSEVVPELVYVALRNSVCLYDWRLGVILNEQLVWTRSENSEFCRIFASSMDGDGRGDDDAPRLLPLLYTYTTDQQLTAWHTTGPDAYVPVSTDVRGMHILHKTAAHVLQSPTNSSRFVVLFHDGGLVLWSYVARARSWRMLRSCPSTLRQPTSLSCPADGRQMCVALADGSLAVLDAGFHQPLRLMHLAYAAGTRIVDVCPHRWNDYAWIATNRQLGHSPTHTHAHQPQVALMHLGSGEVVRVLRQQPTTCTSLSSSSSSSSALLRVTSDSSSTLLLLEFFDARFEVWSGESAKMLHRSEGGAAVCWAPDAWSNEVANLHGSAKLLAILHEDERISLLGIYSDRVSRNATETIRVSVGKTSSRPRRARCAAADARRLIIVNDDGVASIMTYIKMKMSCIVVRLQPPRRGGEAISLAATTFMGDEGRSSCWMAVAYADGTVVVLDVDAGQVMSCSTDTKLLSICATSVFWLEHHHLGVLSNRGEVYVVDAQLRTFHSSVYQRRPRRPLRSSFFFSASHRAYLRAALVFSAHVDDAQEIIAPSNLVDVVDAASYPCRGPFGHIVNHHVQSLSVEMQLYMHSMLLFVAPKMKDVWWNASQLLDDPAHQRLWMELLRSPQSLRMGKHNDDDDRHTTPYLLADELSEATGSAEEVRERYAHVLHLRCRALEANRAMNVCDGRARQMVARQLLAVGEWERAAEVLIDAHDDDACFMQLASSAVAIAAGAAAAIAPRNLHDESTSTSSSGVLDGVATRVAAQHLARGDLDAAVEVQLIAGNVEAACLLCQSRAEWREAVLLAKLASRRAHINTAAICARWAEAWAEEPGRHILACRLWVAAGNIKAALQLLSLHAEVELAGLLAMWATNESGAPLRGAADTQSAEDAPRSPIASYSAVVLRALANYANLLHHVGYLAGEHHVQQRMSRLYSAVTDS